MTNTVWSHTGRVSVIRNDEEKEIGTSSSSSLGTIANRERVITFPRSFPPIS